MAGGRTIEQATTLLAKGVEHGYSNMLTLENSKSQYSLCKLSDLLQTDWHPKDSPFIGVCDVSLESRIKKLRLISMDENFDIGENYSISATFRYTRQDKTKAYFEIPVDTSDSDNVVRSVHPYLLSAKTDITGNKITGDRLHGIMEIDMLDAGHAAFRGAILNNVPGATTYHMSQFASVWNHASVRDLLHECIGLENLAIADGNKMTRQGTVMHEDAQRYALDVIDFAGQKTGPQLINCQDYVDNVIYAPNIVTIALVLNWHPPQGADLDSVVAVERRNLYNVYVEIEVVPSNTSTVAHSGLIVPRIAGEQLTLHECAYSVEAEINIPIQAQDG